MSDDAPPPSRRRIPAEIVLTVAVVVAVLSGIIAVAVSSGGRARPTVVTSSAPSPSVGAPLAVAATPSAEPMGVTLSWSAPTGPAKVVGYLVYRQGTQIASVPAGTTTYTDTYVEPGQAYTYGVVTRAAGFVTSERSSVVVDVPAPGLQMARLEGIFDVTARAVSQTGYVGKIGKLSLGWNFHPTCHTGPCGVHWSDVTSGSLRAILARSGTTYSGSDDGRFIGRCGGARLPSTLSIRIRVTKADVVVGEWRAVRFVGTLKERHPSRLGCVSGGATFLIRGTLTD